MVRLIHSSIHFCITTTSILMGVTYKQVQLIIEILRCWHFSCHMSLHWQQYVRLLMFPLRCSHEYDGFVLLLCYIMCAFCIVQWNTPVRLLAMSMHPGQLAEPIGIGWSLLVPHYIRLGSQLPVGNLELLVENSLHIIVPLQWRVQVLLAAALSFDCLRLWGGTAAVAPLPFRHIDPALWEPSPSHPMLV